ncbi:MAG: protease SohB [Gammaproteobacteria bacterium]|nr:MAG: protease SohB [Gammaproteobacteria bacterium]
MTAILADYGLFLAKLLTLAAILVVLIGAIAGMARRQQSEPELVIERLNERYERMALAIKRATAGQDAWKKARKEARARDKARHKHGAAVSRIFVLDFRGDIRASATTSLREEVSAVIAAAEAGDRVLLRLENAGGTVHEHGLAASQLARLQAAGLHLTVAVDKVAASGGYLMAAMADRILAAPFAILGSIGVIAQLPNFHRWLEARGVDFEQVTAGRYKRTLTVFGENTEAAREKLREELEDIHRLFRDEVARHRDGLDVEAVATGEAWYGTRALELKLVDELGTSDDWLMRAADEADLLHIRWRLKRRLPEKLADRAAGAWNSVIDALAERAWHDRLMR